MPPASGQTGRVITGKITDRETGEPIAGATVKLAEAVRVPVIASGGLTDMNDVKALCNVADSGIMGAITGRAIYEGSIDFQAAQQQADQWVGGQAG